MAVATDDAIPPELKQAVERFVEQSKSLVIGDQQSFDGAVLQRREVATLQKQLAQTKLNATRPLNDALKYVRDQFTELDQSLTSADIQLRNATAIWTRQQAEARLKAQEEVDRKAAAERARLEKRAEAAIAKGDTVKAAVLEERAEAVVAPIIPPVPKAEGISTREVWRFTVVDFDAIPRQYLIPDEKQIGAIVRASKAKTNIPGIEVYSEETDVRSSVRD